MRDRLHFFFLNIGHFLDHLFTLIFATAAALVLTREWGLSYAELIPYATPGFIAFGVFSLPAGWLADRWSREGMIAVFFVGIGLASMVAAFAQSPLQIGIGLFVVGMFAAIYHPVGLALVAAEQKGMGMAIAVNGVWGNLGVASAALLTGLMIDYVGWRAAFMVPGIVSIALGIAYILLFRERMLARNGRRAAATAAPAEKPDHDVRWMLIRVSAIIFFTTAIASIIFQGTTFSLPKVFAERLGGIAPSATVVGWLAFVVFAIASMAQLVVGSLLDKYGPRAVFAGVALIQITFFALMPGLKDWPALLVALGFMLGAFGQIPINDYMIGRMAKSELRASIYGARYIVSFGVLAAVIPLIAWVHGNWGFDTLFRILGFSAGAILLAVLLLPARLPTAEPVVAQPVRA
ncbi:MAG: MFS transporter [Hyphomicrobiaceae bacterium]|nr:MFS transporter [Hyphomicrobiaceae bacterium]